MTNKLDNTIKDILHNKLKFNSFQRWQPGDTNARIWLETFPVEMSWNSKLKKETLLLIDTITKEK